MNIKSLSGISHPRFGISRLILYLSQPTEREVVPEPTRLIPEMLILVPILSQFNNVIHYKNNML
ncbi:hypothetical protein, partial [Klebsiella variicola]|uniref:hypothetical protein n=1 Tax=Klebsiella variicola TaxID=244366 RepID=UPI0019554028